MTTSTTTTSHPTKASMMGYPGTMPTFGPTFGAFNPSFPSGYGASPMTPPGAFFFPPAGPSKFPPMTGMTTPTMPVPTGFGPEAWSTFEPEPWQSFPPYSYRDWPLNVSNIFGPTNPMMASGPMMPPGQTARQSSQTLYNVNFRPANWIEFYTLTNPVRIMDSFGNRMIFLAFDLRGFKPEEINVTFNKADRAIVIEANYEYKTDKEHQMQRKFYRKFVLPDSLKNVDLSKVDVTSTLNINGTLTVEALLPRMSAEEMSKWTGEMHTSHMGMTGMTGFPVTCRPVNA